MIINVRSNLLIAIVLGVTIGMMTTITLHRLFRVILHWLCPYSAQLYAAASKADLSDRIATTTAGQRNVIAPIKEEFLYRLLPIIIIGYPLIHPFNERIRVSVAVWIILTMAFAIDHLWNGWPPRYRYPWNTRELRLARLLMHAILSISFTIAWIIPSLVTILTRMQETVPEFLEITMGYCAAVIVHSLHNRWLVSNHALAHLYRRWGHFTR